MVDEEPSRLEGFAHARIFADPRKFREYVLVPGHSTGKDESFIGTFGYRPRSAADAWTLARLYEEQARQRVESGDVQFRGMGRYGDRYTIVIRVRGVALRFGWILSEGVLRLTTPFSGFARSNPKG